MTVSSRPCPICRHTPAPTGQQLGGYTIQCCPKCALRFAADAFDVPVDYSSVYEMEEYQTQHVECLINTPDKSVFAREATYAPFFAQVPYQPGYRLLDIGCGVGRFCHAAAAKEWDVRGIDISELAISIGQTHAAFPLECLSLEDCVARGDHYDVVTAFEVFEHLADPVQFLKLITRLLRPGGTFFCTVPNWNCRRIQQATRQDWLPPVHLLFYTQPALSTLAEAAGFRQAHTGIISTDPRPADWPRLLQWYGRRLRGKSNHPLGLWLCAQWPGE